MLIVWRKVLSLFSRREKLNILFLFGCSTILSIVEIAGIVSVMPFIAVLTNPELVDTQRFLSYVYQHFHFESRQGFIIALGFSSFIVMTVSHLLDALYTWFSARFINIKEYHLSRSLLKAYLFQHFSSISSRNTSELSKNILRDVENVITGILLSGINIISGIVSALFIIGLLLIIDPYITCGVTLIFVVCYGIIYLFLKGFINRLGQEIRDLYTRMYIHTQQALDGLREIRIFGKELQFLSRYAEPRKAAAENTVKYTSIELIPKQLLEIVAFGSIIAISLYFTFNVEDPGIAYSIIAMFAFAAYRIIPTIQRIFDSLEDIQYYAPYLDGIWDDLQSVTYSSTDNYSVSKNNLPLHAVAFKKVAYQYPGSDKIALSCVDVRVEHGDRLCLLGASGAGKSTTADIMLGLLEPDEGEILFNGQSVTANDIKSWRQRMGYVSQDPYLLDDSVAHNILFGEDETNEDQLIWAAGIAGLDDVFGDLTKESLDVEVGQYGTNLSNGQKQRIAIARALYRNPDLLILDEATNGLDLISEARLLKSLSNLSELTLIFISHRPSIMRFCQRLIIFQQGVTVAHGTYDELIQHPAYANLLA